MLSCTSCIWSLAPRLPFVHVHACASHALQKSNLRSFLKPDCCIEQARCKEMLRGKPDLQDLVDLETESLRLAVYVPEMDAVRGYAAWACWQILLAGHACLSSDAFSYCLSCLPSLTCTHSHM